MADLLGRLKTALAERYAIQRELGAGGMATVFLGEDLKHHRPVAIKVLQPELAAAMGAERFLREIEIAARLNHPHILPLHDSGEADGLLFFVMPYVDGESLRQRLEREKQLPIDDAVRIAREVGDALSYAHAHQVIHRDIKPENVMLTAGHAVVTDFGIARAVTAAGGNRLTQTGYALGTPQYMSPEQAAGAQDLDERSDLYSLGCVFHEMLAGQPPFTGATVEAVIQQHLTAAPPGIASIRPAVPADLVAVVTRALAKAPADRFTRVSAFVDALTRREAATVSAPRRSASSRWRRGALVGGLVGVLVVGAILVGRWIGPLARGTPAHPRTAVAVLPFQNLSAEGPHGYFAGGLHDELLTQLAKVAALSVRGRTSVMGYARTARPIREIADELVVGSIVEGSVQVVGDRLRVNVQLVDAATDEHLWAERYDRTLDDAFAVQSEIAQRVVEAVGAALAASEQQALAEVPTANAEAYRLYLQGQEYRRRPGSRREDLEIAQGFFERALRLDSTFALAHAALSQLHGRMWWFRYDPSQRRLDLQRSEAEWALRLAPELPAAHLAMGSVHYHARRDWQSALDEYRAALDRLPSDAQLWEAIGFTHRRLGNWADMLAAFERLRQLDPRSPGLFYDLGAGGHMAIRRYDEAVRLYDLALSLAPDLHEAGVYRGVTFVLWRGVTDTLRAALAGLPPDLGIGWLGTTRAQRARLLLWERQGDSLLALVARAAPQPFEGQDFYVPPSLYAGWAHSLRGDRAAARAAFDSARVLLDSAIAELPDDWRVHAARGLALAGLGRRDGARREVQWLEQSVAYRRDALQGPSVAEERARILAQLGEADAALDEIERVLRGASEQFSVHVLRLDPRWEPIRDEPRFQQVLVRYDPPRPVEVGRE